MDQLSDMSYIGQKYPYWLLAMLQNIYL